MQHHSTSAGSGPGSGTKGRQGLIDRWQRPSLPCVARAAVHVHPPLAMWFGLLSAEFDWWAALPQASSRPRLLVGAALVINCCSLLQTAVGCVVSQRQVVLQLWHDMPRTHLVHCERAIFMHSVRISRHRRQQQRTTAAARDSSKAQSNTSPPPPKPDPDLRLPPASAPSPLSVF